MDDRRGLFAKKDFEKGDVICIVYGDYKLESGEKIVVRRYSFFFPSMTPDISLFSPPHTHTLPSFQKVTVGSRI